MRILLAAAVALTASAPSFALPPVVDDGAHDAPLVLAKKGKKKDEGDTKQAASAAPADDKQPDATKPEPDAAKPDDKTDAPPPDEKSAPDTPEATPVGQFVDLDGDASPTPVVHSFRGDLLNIKIGTGFAGAQSSPFGARTGYGQVFTEGDWAIGNTGLGFHWDVDLRAAAGLFEQRGQPFGFGLLSPPTYISTQNEPYDPTTTLDDGTTAVDPNNVADNVQAAYYRRAGIFVTGRNTDYLRIDRLYLSYDIDLFGIDVGRVRVPAAQSTVLDGAQVRLDFDIFRLGAFAGFRPNPWHQQVVGASSGGFIPFSIPGGDNPPYEYFQLGWGQLNYDQAYSQGGTTTGPYSNDVGTSLLGFGLPWMQLGSIRHPSVGGWAALRFDPVFMDIGAGVDLFGDPWFAVCESTTPDQDCQAVPDPATNVAPAIDNGQLYRPSNVGPFGATPLGLDRVYVTSTGGVRVFQPLTIAWRGTIDIIGAKPLWIRDLFLDATWRNLGPVNISASYFKINTWATALSYYRFFRPLENGQSQLVNGNPNNADVTGIGLPPDQLNASNLFIVDRDRLRLSISAYVWGSLETYLDLIGERRNDFAYGFNSLDGSSLPNQFTGLGDSLSLLGDLDAQSQQFLCNQSPRDDNGNPVAPSAYALVGSNPTVPVYTDRCKIGATLGIRDAFLANIASFDLHLTHMQGYFSANTRVAGSLGVAWEDRIYVGINGAAERNFVHRVFAPICNASGVCPPDYAPADSAEHAGSTWGYVPQALGAYQLGLDASARVVAGWYVEGAYFGWIEEVPYNGDYYANAAGVPQLRDPYQITHSIYLRTLYRFY